MGLCVTAKTIGQYADGELLPRAEERVRRHLASCPRCARVLEEMSATDAAIRRAAVASDGTPNLAPRVTEELRRRGAFFKARVATGKRRMFGESLLSWRMAAALSVAASLLVMVVVGMDYAARAHWARRTDPVLADAERVLVRLVYVNAAEEVGRLAWARDESRKLALPERLAEARTEGAPVWAGDLAPLEATFVLLAEGQPLPPGLVAQLNDGELLERATRLRRNLSAGG